MRIFFLYVHILSAVVSIGPLVSLLPMLKKMEKADDGELKGFVQAFKISIDVVKHAGHVLVISGAVLIGVSHWRWTTSWVVLTIAIMFASIVFLAKAFKPTLSTFNTKEFQKDHFIKKLRIATIKYILLLLIMLLLMVVKPNLW